MGGTISVEIILGLGAICTVIVGAITWLSKQTKEIVATHNENAEAHEDLRREIQTVDRKVEKLSQNFENYVESHEKFVNAKTNEIVQAIKDIKK